MTSSTCGTCSYSRRTSGAHWCYWCLRDLREMAVVLAGNLAVVGGLCRAFDLGRDIQHPLTNADGLDTKRDRDWMRAKVMREYFHPGCGRPAT